jgi:hypothetical protein
MINAQAYQERVAKQIGQFNNVAMLWKLPPIYQYWSNRYIKPRFKAVFGKDSIFDAYYDAIAAAAARYPERQAILCSIGTGDCQIEIQLAARLKLANVRNVRIICLELSSVRLDRARALARDCDVDPLLDLRETDLNHWEPRELVDVFMAHHSLHHLVSLEAIYDTMVETMYPDGVFLTADMIGRNGHQRWPETLHWIEQIWHFAPKHYKYNFQFNRFHENYLDWDCSRSGFEGVRAQEVLPLLVERLDFDAFIGYGGIIDPWVDRGYGQSLDPNNPADTAFIDFMEELNQTLIEADKIKPTMMMAHFTLPNRGAKRTWNGLTPARAVRQLAPSDRWVLPGPL